MNHFKLTLMRKFESRPSMRANLFPLTQRTSRFTNRSKSLWPLQGAKRWLELRRADVLSGPFCAQRQQLFHTQLRGTPCR